MCRTANLFWNVARQATRAISTTSRRELLSSFFPDRQGAEGNSGQSDRNISRTCTIVCHRQKLVRSVETCWFFHLCYASYLTIQSSDHLQIIDQIHDFVWEDILISTKSIAEQLDISCGWVRSIIHEDLDMLKLSSKWSRNSWTSTVRIVSAISGIFSAMRDPNDFLSRLAIMDKNWLYHYDSETKQQSMEWRHGASPQPSRNNSEWKKNLMEKFSSRFLGSRWLRPHWLSSEGSNYHAEC